MHKCILVVDDDFMTLRMAEMFLKKGNYQVVTAQSGEACLEALKNQTVDLVLLDMEMPEMDGLQTLQQIRGEKLCPGTPIYFLSGSDDVKDQVEKGVYPAEGFIHKPFLPAELLEAMERILS